MKFGQLFKARRIELSLPLRGFCLVHDLDPGNISKMERGIFSPPQDINKIVEYAKMLKIERGSDAWQLFFDLAAIGAGLIPPDLLLDEAVVEKLPALFRILR